jgi:hypothetical protein
VEGGARRNAPVERRRGQRPHAAQFPQEDDRPRPEPGTEPGGGSPSRPRQLRGPLPDRLLHRPHLGRAQQKGGGGGRLRVAPPRHRARAARRRRIRLHRAAHRPWRPAIPPHRATRARTVDVAPHRGMRDEMSQRASGNE